MILLLSEAYFGHPTLEWLSIVRWHEGYFGIRIWLEKPKSIHFTDVRWLTNTDWFSRLQIKTHFNFNYHYSRDVKVRDVCIISDLRSDTILNWMRDINLPSTNWRNLLNSKTTYFYINLLLTKYFSMFFTQ